MTASLSRDEEARLVVQAREDADAFGVLYEAYVERIYNYIYYHINNHQDTEDLTARVFYRTLANIDNYQERGVPFSAWLYRIAHNLVANFHRDRSRRNVITLDEFVVAGNERLAPEAATESREEQEQLMAAVRQLPEERQQLLLLKFIDHLSNAEIGAIMERSEGAIKSLYHRTLIALREELKAKGHGESDGQPDEKPRARRWLRKPRRNA
jgi:RNA polymerase sigma-70 factor (ECF subfamily)